MPTEGPKRWYPFPEHEVPEGWPADFVATSDYLTAKAEYEQERERLLDLIEAAIEGWRLGQDFERTAAHLRQQAGSCNESATTLATALRAAGRLPTQPDMSMAGGEPEGAVSVSAPEIKVGSVWVNQHGDDLVVEGVGDSWVMVGKQTFAGYRSWRLSHATFRQEHAPAFTKGES